MFKPKVVERLKEIGRLQAEREEIENERDEYLKSDWTVTGLFRRNRKLNRLSRRITYLYNLKSVYNVAFNMNTAREAHKIIRGAK